MLNFLKEQYNKLQAHFGWFITVILMISIISYLIGLLLVPKIEGDSPWWLTGIKHLSSILMMIGSAGVTAAIFQVIIKSTAFMEVLKDTLDIDERTWGNYSDNKIKDVLRSIKSAKSFVNISYIDEKEKSIKLARKAFLREQEKIKAKRDKTLADIQLLEKNYILEESRITKTIVKNGSEITTFELDIRFFKKGGFVFRVQNWTESENVFYPIFVYFKDNSCDKRFFDFSFSSTYFNLTKKEKIVPLSRYAKLKIESKDYDTSKGFDIVFSIDDSFEKDDFLTLSFSTTIKDTYTDENIKRIESGADPKPFSASSSPVGVRRITIQEEVYGNATNESRIRPTLKIDDAHIEPSSESQSIFYKKHHWTIYYKDYEYEKIEYSVV